MRASTSAQPALAAVLALLLTAPRLVSAGPLVDDNNELGVAYDFLLARANCDGTLCGYNDQLCCSAGSACYTDANTQAQCSATAGSGSDGWAYYTTTYTETDLQTITSVWSSYTASSVAPATTVACQASLGETACGAICCASDQYCLQSGQCMAYGSGSSSYSNAVRPTSGSNTATSTVKVTTTQPFVAPATASNSITADESTSGPSLSGGAIAGIVIGTLAGIALLAAICFCCVLRAGCDALLGIFGLGSKRRRRSTERVEVIEERYSRHGSAAGAGRTTHGGWFGAGRRPARTETVTTKKKTSGMGNLGMVGAGLAGLALILGLKRRQDRLDEKSRPSRAGTSRYSYSDYTYTDSYTGTSESSVSDDRITRETRRTERSRRP